MNKPVIVCIDDEPTVLDSLTIELNKYIGEQCLIETAESGDEALELLTELLAEEYEVALVMSDYIMPEMKGDEVLKRIHEISPNSLKIMLTGQADIEAVGNAIKYAKLYRYIAKPWQPEDLKLTVREAVNSYVRDKQLASQNVQLQQMNQKLEQLNQEQAALITKLHEKESRLRQFLEAMPVGVGVLDVNGKPYYINQRAKELFGKGVVPDTTMEQLSEVYQVYQAGTKEQYPSEKLPIVRALQGETVTSDDLEIHQGDKIIPVEIWATPIYDEAGNIVYGINAIQDITERQEAEADRQKFIEDLFEVNCNLELALQAESELTTAADRFVPDEFISFLGRESIVDVQLGDNVQQEMSVLFSDIRDFTTLSESMTPSDSFKLINAYLSRMEPAINENNGFIDKYIGDAIMALFSGGADDAVKAAIAMLNILREYNTTRQRPERPPLSIGIGINTGDLMLGVVGGKSRMDSTVIGDTVNLASRVESMTKKYPVSLLITHHTFWGLKNSSEYNLRIIDKVKVKGKSELVTIYEVFDADAEKIKEGKLTTKTAFEQAVVLYNMKAFTEAAQLFADCLGQNPEDKVPHIYLERCQQKLNNRDWGGTGEFSSQ
ncbi:MAG: adenylate/guanylate cyclase domain-containing protein [Hormoscilla sp.]